MRQYTDPVSTPLEIFDEEFWRDPYPAYSRLRQDAPVQPVVTPDGMRVWLVTRYEDVRAALADPRLSKELTAAQHLYRRHTASGVTVRQVNGRVARHMLSTDPPDHTRLRKLVGKAFTAGRVEKLQPRVESVSQALLDALPARDEVDLIAGYAFPLAFTVICELLGLPQTDREQFRQWTQDYNSSGSPELVNAASDAIAAYVSELIAAERRRPGVGLLSGLIEVTDGGDRLSESELVSLVFLLLSAGHETTVNLIAGGMLALLNHPEQLALLRSDLSLLPTAVEELLRFDSPVNTATHRFTTQPVVIGGTEIPQDEFVLVCLASANRDRTRFDGPDRLDITRSAQGHVSFGHGIHYCLGAPLARQEGEVAFRHWLSRYPRIELARPGEPLEYRRSLLMRGLTSLTLRVDRQAALAG